MNIGKPIWQTTINNGCELFTIYKRGEDVYTIDYRVWAMDSEECCWQWCMVEGDDDFVIWSKAAVEGYFGIEVP